MDVLRCTRICYRAGGRGCLPRDGGCPNVSSSSWTPQFPCWPAHLESSADASRKQDLAEFALVMSLCLDRLEHLALVGAILINSRHVAGIFPVCGAAFPGVDEVGDDDDHL